MSYTPAPPRLKPSGEPPPPPPGPEHRRQNYWLKCDFCSSLNNPDIMHCTQCGAPLGEQP